jgi:hypothetical protein
MADNQVSKVLKDAQRHTKTFVDFGFVNEQCSTSLIKRIGQ